MTCLHPYYLERLGFAIPCRKCIQCRIQYTREWKIRLMHELEYHKEACFITLTYRDEDLPEDRSLDKKVLQNFIKRLRKKIEPVKIKYYACGEYGKEHDREHYHLIVFGWEPSIGDLKYVYRKKGKNYYGSEIISALWSYGFNTVGTVTNDSCQYVVGYVRKKLTGAKAQEVYRGRIQPFALQSTGIGAQFAYDKRHEIKERLSVTQGNKNVGLPRYYARIVGPDTERMINKRKEKDDYSIKHLVESGLSDEAVYEAVKEAKGAKEKRLKAEEKLRSLQ